MNKKRVVTEIDDDSSVLILENGVCDEDNSELVLVL